MNGVEHRQARVAVPIPHAHQQHIRLPFHVSDELGEQHINMHLPHRGNQPGVNGRKPLRSTRGQDTLYLHDGRVAATRQLGVYQGPHFVQQLVKGAVFGVLDRVARGERPGAVMIADRLPIAHPDQNGLPAALEESAGNGHEDEQIGLNDRAVDHDLHAPPGHAQIDKLVRVGRINAGQAAPQRVGQLRAQDVSHLLAGPHAVERVGNLDLNVFGFDPVLA